MVNKGVSVWLFSSLTFIASAHLLDSASALIFNNEIRLLQIYPIIGEKLCTLAPVTYFWISVGSTLIFWGITCAIAFENPVETFLNKIFSDAKTQSAVEAQMLESKGEILDEMYETIESDNQVLGEVKDLMCNVRADVKEIQPLKETMDKLKAELTAMKKELRKVEERLVFPDVCPTCGKPVLHDFKVCPYCGANLRLLPKQVIAVEDYR